jgi:hypothetical protein
MNLAALSAYPYSTNKLCWNQMSDRLVPSVQRATIPTGFNTSLNRRHTSVTSSRPGCQTPGGIGCDIKHNSYDRYLNRIKAKRPLKQGIIPPNFGAPIIFNQAYPIYGGKTVKTNIITGCNCSSPYPTPIYASDDYSYYDTMYSNINTTNYSLGQTVYALQTGNTYYTKAVIIEVNIDGTYNIKFNNGIIQENITASDLYLCSCNYTNNVSSTPCVI